MDTVVDLLAAIGSISVAILAIWGDSVRSKLVPSKLALKLDNPRGSVTQFTNGTKVVIYHLKVTNLRRWRSLKNCRVMLSALHKRGPDGLFHPVPLDVSLQYIWAPSEFAPPLQAISKEAILDFAWVIEHGDTVIPRLYVTTNNFGGFVKGGEAVRYSLEIVADDYASPRYQVFEIAWNGKWSDNLDAMSQNLVLREVEPDEDS